jgi:hypothetical protein
MKSTNLPLKNPQNIMKITFNNNLIESKGPISDNKTKINHFSQTIISVNISSPLSAAEPL